MKQNNLLKKETDQLITNLEFESKLDILLEGQTKNSEQLQHIREDLRKGFVGLALRNEDLLKSNEQLKQQLEIVVEELNQIKQERQEKEIRKQARANRKRLPKRDPVQTNLTSRLILKTKLLYLEEILHYKYPINQLES